jgi:acyl-CoA synthetase (NDP forming)
MPTLNASPLQDIFQVFFNPNAVVIIGASRNEYTFNGVLVKNLLEAQYKGKIWVVHPFTDQIMGIRCVPSLDELLKRIKSNSPKIDENRDNSESIIPIDQPDLAIILTPRDLVNNIEQLGKMGIKNIMIEADLHFDEDKGDRPEIINKILQLKTIYDLHILGPTMIGIIDFAHHFTSSIIPVRSHIISPGKKHQNDGGVSFLAQSGGLSGACGWWDPPQNLPFAKVIHIGEAIDITEAQILEYLFTDSQTKIIILFLKEIPPRFVQILRQYIKQKPVLYKYVGRENPIEREFQAAGAMPVANYVELFEFAKVFLWSPPASLPSVGIIGPSSGAINLLIAEMRQYGIHLAKLEEKNKDFILQKIGGSTCKLGNPVDYWPPAEFIGTQICRVYHNASQTLLNDPHVGALFLALEFFTEIEFDFNIFERIKTKFPDKPIICILIQAEKEGRERILRIATDLRIPVFIDEIERGVRAYRYLLNFYQQ